MKFELVVFDILIFLNLTYFTLLYQQQVYRPNAERIEDLQDTRSWAA